MCWSGCSTILNFPGILLPVPKNPSLKSVAKISQVKPVPKIPPRCFSCPARSCFSPLGAHKELRAEWQLLSCSRSWELALSPARKTLESLQLPNPRDFLGIRLKRRFSNPCRGWCWLGVRSLLWFLRGGLSACQYQLCSSSPCLKKGKKKKNLLCCFVVLFCCFFFLIASSLLFS